jgi:hypothetical protein
MTFTRLMRTAFATCAMFFCLMVAVPAQAYVPSVRHVDPTHVTYEELRVIATWENGPLWRDVEGRSGLVYPVESDAAACTARGCLNGCTIGIGYNMGAHSYDQVLHAMLASGVDVARAKYFAHFAGKTGVDAVALCGKDVLTGHEPTLSRTESLALLRLMVAHHKANVVARARAEGMLNKLSSGQFAVLVALDYQNPVLSSEATYIWRALKAGDTARVVSIIKNASGSQITHALQARRNWEASYFKWASTRRALQISHHGHLLPALDEEA